MIILLFIWEYTTADFSISWYTIDGGGGTSSGGPYELSGTIGLPDADYLDSGDYELLGGFWVGGPLCIVNLEHFATFASHWLDGPCNESNNWCDGADLNQEDDVTFDDLRPTNAYLLPPPAFPPSMVGGLSGYNGTLTLSSGVYDSVKEPVGRFLETLLAELPA